MSITPLYTAVATARGGRQGHVTSDDAVIDLDTSTPKGLGGPGGLGTNPEQLFAAGYSACFSGAVGLVAMRQKIKPGDFTITAHVSIGKAGEGFGLAVELHAKFPDLSTEQAEALVAAAHQVCPYSNATRNNIDVKLVVE